MKNSYEESADARVEVVFSDLSNGLEIRVEDDGPGFDSTVIKKSFEPYLSTKKDGSGLGLVICQRIIHDHGGTIELYNRAKGGAGVVMRLPMDNG
jgi:nitrogen fixation/metabolism regulation signal transduction histidine kinase